MDDWPELGGIDEWEEEENVHDWWAGGVCSSGEGR